MKNLSSRTLKHMTIGVWTFFTHVKEEIYVITFADLIGSLGGSLGMFFGFSISAYTVWLLDSKKTMIYQSPGVTTAPPS